MPIAFFDFDETIVREKSMFAFLSYYISCASDFDLRFDEIIADIQRRQYAGATRADINAYYYTLYAGRSQQELRSIACDFTAAGNLRLKPEIVDQLRSHASGGDEVVVVSGSMRDIIDPTMRTLGITTALCAEPEVAGGRYTGRLSNRAIGPDKARRVLEYCAACDVSAESCTAYGDDISDAEMLSAVGTGVVVDPGPELLALAQSKNWTVVKTTKRKVS